MLVLMLCFPTAAARLGVLLLRVCRDAVRFESPHSARSAPSPVPIPSPLSPAPFPPCSHRTSHAPSSRPPVSPSSSPASALVYTTSLRTCVESSRVHLALARAHTRARRELRARADVAAARSSCASSPRATRGRADRACAGRVMHNTRRISAAAHSRAVLLHVHPLPSHSIVPFSVQRRTTYPAPCTRCRLRTPTPPGTNSVCARADAAAARTPCACVEYPRSHIHARARADRVCTGRANIGTAAHCRTAPIRPDPLPSFPSPYSSPSYTHTPHRPLVVLLNFVVSLAFTSLNYNLPELMPQPGVPGQSSPFIQGGGGRAPIPPNDPRNGSVVFSIEAVNIVKKLGRQRVERNKKRAERRAAGDEDVSDDEVDELAAYMMVVPSQLYGEGSAPDGEEDALGGCAGAPANSQRLFDDEVAEKNTFQAHDTSIPAAIFSLAKNGISPPLTIFLPASLARIRASNVKTVKHGTGETTKVTVLDIADFPKEFSLDQATWSTTYNTFLTFLQLAVGPRTFDSFARHYNRILSDPEIGVWFPAYRAFDHQIRAQFFTKPYIIDIADPEYRSALQSARDTFILANRPVTDATSSIGRAGPSRDKGDRYRPYDRDTTTDRRTNTLCFRCGRVGHNAHRCDESTPSKHGRQFVVFANREGLFRISDKRAVCAIFNIGRCDKGQNHALHICSLCADAHHGAAGCTRN
ncbi:hypothetical protein B0H16DRAFT_1741438 [Mycena metata]|uniref:CCHC-type domain-containing protein n=1 Tax=Mycena metata TaxID=1033252 RepID=A0AAD7HAA9_9AGAR|nr:hypothetical protein B0H16DRAFT_1741438 [Mycena metata]